MLAGSGATAGPTGVTTGNEEQRECCAAFRRGGGAALWGFWFEEGSEVGLPVFSRHNKESPGGTFSFLFWD